MVMNTPKIEKLRDDLLEEEVLEYNREAMNTLLQEWCINISENMLMTRQAASLKGYHKLHPRSAIVVGAAPELTDADILELADYKGDVIITNKNYKRFTDLMVQPDWVCLLDAHPISLMQFSWMRENQCLVLPRTKFLVSSVAHPTTVKIIMEVAGAQNVYMFNPSSDEVFVCSECGSHIAPIVKNSKIWQWMNDKPEMEHGGSVGCLAVTLAKLLRYRSIGLMGFGLYEKPNPKWTIEQAKEREFIYYPDTDENVALPMNFKSYLTYIAFEAMDSKSWAKWYNLSDSPVLRHSPNFLQSTVKEYVNGWEKWLEESNGTIESDDESMGREDAKES